MTSESYYEKIQGIKNKNKVLIKIRVTNYR